MQQPSLLDYPNSAGWREPTTSRDAAVKLESCGRAERDRERVLFALRRPATCKELAAILDMDINSVRPCCTELKAKGLIEATGEIRDRQHVWVAV